MGYFPENSIYAVYLGRCYQPNTNLVKDENGDLLADSHSSHNILNMWKNHFSQLLNVHRVSGVVDNDNLFNIHNCYTGTIGQVS
jgi:hypothetical protein